MGVVVRRVCAVVRMRCQCLRVAVVRVSCRALRGAGVCVRVGRRLRRLQRSVRVCGRRRVGIKCASVASRRVRVVRVRVGPRRCVCGCALRCRLRGRRYVSRVRGLFVCRRCVVRRARVGYACARGWRVRASGVWCRDSYVRARVCARAVRDAMSVSVVARRARATVVSRARDAICRYAHVDGVRMVR